MQYLPITYHESMIVCDTAKFLLEEMTELPTTVREYAMKQVAEHDKDPTKNFYQMGRELFICIVKNAPGFADEAGNKYNEIVELFLTQAKDLPTAPVSLMPKVPYAAVIQALEKTEFPDKIEALAKRKLADDKIGSEQVHRWQAKAAIGATPTFHQRMEEYSDKMRNFMEAVENIPSEEEKRNMESENRKIGTYTI